MLSSTSQVKVWSRIISETVSSAVASVVSIMADSDASHGLKDLTITTTTVVKPLGESNSRADEEREPEPPEDVGTEVEEAAELLSEPVQGREERIALIRDMASSKIKNSKKKSGPKVGEKRDRATAAFGDFEWGALKRLYTDSNGDELEFEPVRVSLSDPKFKLITDMIQVYRETGGIRTLALCNEAVVGQIVDIILRVTASDNNCRVNSEVTMESTDLCLNGRADRVISKQNRNLVVVECKRGDGNFNKGFAQMVLGAEVVLNDLLKVNPDSEANVYGIATNSISWRFFKLNRHDGRFYDMVFDLRTVKESVTDISGIILGMMKGEVPEQEVGVSEKRRKCSQ